MEHNNKEQLVDIDSATLGFNLLLTSAIGYLGWDKRQDKLKLKEHGQELNDLRVTVARQDERHNALVADVSEIKEDTKDIKRMLMERA